MTPGAGEPLAKPTGACVAGVRGDLELVTADVAAATRRGHRKESLGLDQLTDTGIGHPQVGGDLADVEPVGVAVVVITQACERALFDLVQVLGLAAAPSRGLPRDGPCRGSA